MMGRSDKPLKIFLVISGMVCFKKIRYTFHMANKEFANVYDNFREEN